MSYEDGVACVEMGPRGFFAFGLGVGFEFEGVCEGFESSVVEGEGVGAVMEDFVVSFLGFEGEGEGGIRLDVEVFGVIGLESDCDHGQEGGGLFEGS